MAWLHDGFVAPARVRLPTGRHHLRQIDPADTALDMAAVMGSRERLWSIFGRAWGWPPATLTEEQDRDDLARHAREMRCNESFNYALFDSQESALFGCVYIDPAEKVGADADISWWVVDRLVGTPLETELDRFVPGWIADAWPFRQPRHIGQDLTWDDWMELPDA